MGFGHASGARTSSQRVKMSNSSSQTSAKHSSSYESSSLFVARPPLEAFQVVSVAKTKQKQAFALSSTSTKPQCWLDSITTAHCLDIRSGEHQSHSRWPISARASRGAIHPTEKRISNKLLLMELIRKPLKCLLSSYRHLVKLLKAAPMKHQPRRRRRGAERPQCCHERE